MSQSLQNPHLEGGPFFWQGGPVGVLLVHGLTATTAEMRPLAQDLHAHGYTVAGTLLPGHFAEPADVNRYRWRDWVELVGEAYGELRARCERVVVGGESTGAVIALYLATEHPEIDALLMYAPALRLQRRRRDIAMVNVLAPFIPYVRKKVGAPSEADALWQGYFVNPLKGARELIRLQKVVRPRLSSISQPILIVQGRLDASVHPDAPQEIYDGVASTVKELHWMDRSSHCVTIDCDRNEVFDLTRKFLERVLDAPQG